MNKKSLLRDLERMPCRQRMAHMVEVGRKSQHDHSIVRVIAELWAGNVYEQSLALQSTFGSRDGSLIVQASNGDSRSIRGLAQYALPHVCTDEEVRAVLRQTSRYSRYPVMARLIKYARQKPVNAFLQELAEAHDDQLSELLALGSDDLVRRHMNPTLASARRHDWIRLARLHPDRVLDYLNALVNATSQFDPKLLRLTNAVLPMLSKKRPAQTLAFIRQLTNTVPVQNLNLDRLVRKNPEDTLRFLLAIGAAKHFYGRVEHLIHRFTTETILELIRQNVLQPSSHSLRSFGRLRYAQLRAIYEAYGEGWRDDDGVLILEFVKHLPGELRQREARRCWDLPALLAQPDRRLLYASLLPWDEATKLLDPYIHNPNASLRQQALSALIGAIRYDLEHAGDALAFMMAHRHEQDPVRMSMLFALRDIPPHIWTESHVSDLAQIIQDAMNAPDASYWTIHIPHEIILRILPFHPLWAINLLPNVIDKQAQSRFHSGYYYRPYALSNQQTRQITAAIYPVLQNWHKNGHEDRLVYFAAFWGKRLRDFEGLLDILESIVRTTRVINYADQALTLIIQYDRNRAHRLIPELLARDESWITLNSVSSYLHQYRQDLLMPFLKPHIIKGRMSTQQKRPFVLPVYNNFHRWTADQQRTFAQGLQKAIGDTRLDQSVTLHAIRQLAALPIVHTEKLVELASSEIEIVRSYALSALGDLDGGQGLPVLMAAMQDKRARVAIYALRRTLLEMPPERAMPHLRQMPMKQVSAAKEIVRLIGEQHTSASFDYLLELDQQTDLHRDIRVALIRALWNYLDQDAAWLILERAIQSDDAALASIVARTPAERLSSEGQERLIRIMTQLVQHPDVLVRLETLRRCRDLPVADPHQYIIPVLIRALHSALPEEVEAAGQAIFAIYYTEYAAIEQAVRDILPERRALDTFLDVLSSLIVWRQPYFLPSLRLILADLAHDPLTINWQVQLAVEGLPWQETTQFLIEQSQRDTLHADAVRHAEEALQQAHLRRDIDEIGHLEAALREHPDPRLRRLGLSALQKLSESPRGWTGERLRLLEHYRQDQSILVAAAAQFIFPIAASEV